jgi:mannose-1-phosphate guanylyltransferase
MPQAVILAGGQGERFWPLTHEGFPKYRIRLDNGHSLLQKTYHRLRGVYSPAEIHVVTTQDHVPFILEELPSFKRSQIFVEPARKNTTGAIFLAMSLLEKRFGGDEIVSFFPADQLIESQSTFKQTLEEAIRLAKQDPFLVTIGIEPAFPATGYGYIEAGRAIGKSKSAFKVSRFKEKPSRATALKYLRKKRFFWNAGMFAWRTKVFMDTMKKFCPQIFTMFDLSRLDSSYARLPKISIDYALLEKAPNIAVVKARMDWCDMGNWDMFFDKTDRAGDNFIFQDASRPLVVFGVSGLEVIHTDRGTLICKKGEAEEAARFATAGK